jgi:two-component system invasion response regulator UvrY
MLNFEKIPAPLKVALVDDHVLLRQSLKGYIHNHAGECSVVLEGDDGRVLKDQLNTMPVEKIPDIVVLDINMPNMDGYETLRWLKRHYPNIRIIMLSMFSDDTTIIRCLRLGANSYMTKMVDGDELIHTIRTVGEKGEYYSQRIATLAVASLKQKSEVESTEQLTPKELEFVKLVCTELTYKEIADRMGISPRTVDVYRYRALEKLRLKNRVGLVMHALKNKLVL